MVSVQNRLTEALALSAPLDHSIPRADSGSGNVYDGLQPFPTPESDQAPGFHPQRTRDLPNPPRMTQTPFARSSIHQNEILSRVRRSNISALIAKSAAFRRL